MQCLYHQFSWRPVEAMQRLNLVVMTVLVDILVGFFAPEIFNKNKSPSFIKFLIKWYFNAMCLHLEWRIGFLARKIAFWLSLNNRESSCSFPNSFRRFFNHIISFAGFEIAAYSASVVEREILPWSLHFQLIVVSPNVKM